VEVEQTLTLFDPSETYGITGVGCLLYLWVWSCICHIVIYNPIKSITPIIPLSMCLTDSQGAPGRI